MHATAYRRVWGSVSHHGSRVPRFSVRADPAAAGAALGVWSLTGSMARVLGSSTAAGSDRTGGSTGAAAAAAAAVVVAHPDQLELTLALAPESPHSKRVLRLAFAGAADCQQWAECFRHPLACHMHAGPADADDTGAAGGGGTAAGPGPDSVARWMQPPPQGSDGAKAVGCHWEDRDDDAEASASLAAAVANWGQPGAS
eukprot:SAG22_NODE_1306_length_4792_cov_369.145962_3_plen_199_part_00